jgi:ADP-ribosylglycohydrolase
LIPAPIHAILFPQTVRDLIRSSLQAHLKLNLLKRRRRPHAMAHEVFCLGAIGGNMYGSIAGDIIGSRFERHNTSNYDFDLFTEHSSFTDDTVMTVAVMESLNGWLDLEPCIRNWQALFPNAGFGPRFQAWIGGHGLGDSKGNGGAIRAAPYAWVPYTWDDFREIVEDRTSITHGSREAIDAAWAIASTIRHLREGKSREYVQKRLQAIAPEYRNLTWPPRVKRPGALASDSVPAALAAALNSTNFEDAIRKAVSIGGDSDTIASMAGAVAEALYGVPDEIIQEVRDRLTPDMLMILDEFYRDWVNLDPVVVEANPSFMFERAASARYERALQESFRRMKVRKEGV